jgi:hypothetical protein
MTLITTHCSQQKSLSERDSFTCTVQFQYFQYRYFQRGKKIQILISVLYPIFSARHKNLFSKCQKFRVTRCTIPIFSAFSIFVPILSPKLLKILELNCILIMNTLEMKNFLSAKFENNSVSNKRILEKGEYYSNQYSLSCFRGKMVGQF